MDDGTYLEEKHGVKMEWARTFFNARCSFCKRVGGERERPERDPSVRADLHWPAANCEDFEDMLPECLQAQVEEKLNLSEDIEAPKVRKGIGSEENKGVYLANRVFFLSS